MHLLAFHNATTNSQIGFHYYDKPTTPSISQKTLLATAGIGYLPHLANAAYAPNKSAKGMRFGLVTYLWGKDMDLPTLLDVCEKSGVLGLNCVPNMLMVLSPNYQSYKERRSETLRG